MWPFLVTLFPFLVFHYPHNRPSYCQWWNNRRSARSSLPSEEPDVTPGPPSKTPATMRMHAARFTMLLLGTMLTVCYIVYICFSFNKGSSYPFVGTTVFWWVLMRNVVMIVLFHILCVHISQPNKERLRMMDFDMGKVDSDLAHVGVFHTSRKLLAFITRRPFKMRWFTTFLSDNILLTLTFVCNVAHGAIKVSHDPSTDRAVSYVFHVYRAVLLLGFIMYSLDFAPKVSHAHTYGFKAILLFAVSMNLADFFFHTGDSVSQNGIERAIGAGAQLFITHSTVLLLAIMGGHHMHAHASPDLPWRGLLKIASAMLCGGVWLAYAVLWSYNGTHDTTVHSWVPESYVYSLWGLNVVGGFFCVSAAFFHAGSRTPTLQLVKLGDHVASVENTAVEPEEQDQGLDFDVMLIVITFVVSSMFFASEIFGALSLNEIASMFYWICAPAAPIGLSVLAVTAWWRPPAKARLSLYVGLFLAASWLGSVEVAEDCHKHGTAPACCEYPWVQDSRHHFEHAHEAPECETTVADAGHCLAQIGAENSIPIVFSAVSESVTGVVVVGTMGDGTIVLEETLTDVQALVQTTVCRDESESVKFGSERVETTAGCYGMYLYQVPELVAAQCVAAECSFEIQTLNCAFMRSPALKIVSSATAMTEGSFVWDPKRETDTIESTFYSFFKVVGLAALLECFFTLFGVIFKLIVLSESRTETAQTSMRFRSRRSTTVFDAYEPDRTFDTGHHMEQVTEEIEQPIPMPIE